MNLSLQTIKVSDTLEHQPTVWPVSTETAVHGYHCLVDMTVHMHKVTKFLFSFEPPTFIILPFQIPYFLIFLLVFLGKDIPWSHT